MTVPALLATEANPQLPQVDSIGGFIVAMAMVVLVYGGYQAILALVRDHRRERPADAIAVAEQVSDFSARNLERIIQQNDALAAKLDKLEKKNEKLEERVSALERSNSDLARQIDSYRKRVQTLRNHIDMLVDYIRQHLPGDDAYPKLVEHDLVDAEM